MKDKKKHSKHDDGLTDEEEALLKSYALLAQVKAALAAQKISDAGAEGNQGNLGSAQAGAQRSTSVTDSKQNEQLAVDAAQATERARQLVQSGVIKLRVAEPTQIIAAHAKARRPGRKIESAATVSDVPQRSNTEQLERQAQLRKAHNQFVRSSTSQAQAGADDSELMGESAISDRDDGGRDRGRNRNESETSANSNSGGDFFNVFTRMDSDRHANPARAAVEHHRSAGSESDTDEQPGHRSPDRNYPAPGTIVFVECSGLAESDLVRAAEQCGDLVNLRYDESRGRAYLTYASRNGALRAIDELDKAVIRGKLIRADFLRPAQRQTEPGTTGRGSRPPFRGRGGRGGRGGRPFRGGPHRSPQRGGFDYRSPYSERERERERDRDRGASFGSPEGRRPRMASESEDAPPPFARRDDVTDIGASFIPGGDDAADDDNPYFDAPSGNTSMFDSSRRRSSAFYVEASADADGDEPDWYQTYGGSGQTRSTNEREDMDADRKYERDLKRIRNASESMEEQLVDDSAAVRREMKAEPELGGWASAINSKNFKRRKQ